MNKNKCKIFIFIFIIFIFIFIIFVLDFLSKMHYIFISTEIYLQIKMCRNTALC